jgi:phosphate starvation-inducible PhoH-like protein
MSNNARRNKKKEVLETKPQPKSKFLQTETTPEGEIVQPNLPKFEAKTNSQKKALAALRSGASVVFMIGSAGSGKSMLASYEAASSLKQKKVDKIYLARPNVATGKTIGMLPGTLEEKLEPFFAQTIEHLRKFMGSGFTNYCLRTKTIEMKAIEYLRGTSFENCIVILEESQNFTADDLEMVLTRIGNNCRLILTGDTRQNDLKGNSGLAKTLKLLEDMIELAPDYLDDEDMKELDDNVAIIEFKPEDVVRSGITKSFVKIYYNN